MAVLPLGTGNDLARTLGWGPGYKQEPLGPIIEAALRGKEVLLDRWAIEIFNEDGDDERGKQLRYLNNYFSVGLDAKIALEFHQQREENPDNFKNASMNR